MVGGSSGKPEWVLSAPPAHARAVLEPLQGSLVGCLRRARRDPCGPLVVRVPQEVEDDSASTVWTCRLWVPYSRGREAASPSTSGTVPGIATTQVPLRSAARATLGGVSAGPAP